MGKPTTAELMQLSSEADPEIGRQGGQTFTDTVAGKGSDVQQTLGSLQMADREQGEDLGIDVTRLADAIPSAPSTLVHSYDPPTSLPFSLSHSNTPKTLSWSSSWSSSMPFGTPDNENDFSDQSPESDPSEVVRMCTPRVARELSLGTGGFVAVTGFDPEEGEDEPEVTGLALHGYINGDPVYYQTEGMYSELKAIETDTAIGLQYVQQPIESCFGRMERGRGASTNDGSGSRSLTGTEDGLPSPNRTFSNAWFAVGKSPLGGYGIFAIVDIPRFTHILLERPFIGLRYHCQLAEKYVKLTPEEKLAFDSLHEYDKENRDDPVHRRWNTNSFVVGKGEGCFAIASNFNHACHSKRNTQYCWDAKRGVMTFTAIRDVAKGEEIFISYGTSRYALQQKFGFLCQCGGCEGMCWQLPTMSERSHTPPPPFP